MTEAVIRLYHPDMENPKIIGRVWIESRKVKMSFTNPRLKAELESEGIRVGDGKVLFPKDGVKFVRAIPLHFRGGLVGAQVTDD